MLKKSLFLSAVLLSFLISASAGIAQQWGNSQSGTNPSGFGDSGKTIVSSRSQRMGTDAKIFGTDVPVSGLVAEYLFEGSARDTSGSGHHGTEEGGLTYVAGKIGKAAGFDGKNDGIRIADDRELEFGKGALTVSAWIYPKVRSRMMAILDHMVDTGCRKNTNERSFLLRIRDNRINLIMNGKGELKYNHQYKSRKPIKTNQWHFITVSFDGTSMNIYHNLKKVIEARYTGGLFDSSAPWYIGARHCRQKDPQWFHGKIDNIRIYNRALSIAEIQDLYAEGASREKPDAITQSSPPGIEKGGQKSDEPWLAAELALPGAAKMKAHWQEVGRQRNPAGDLSIWGYFFADSADVDWGDSASPEVFADICKSVDGHMEIDFYNVSRGQVHVLSAYPWPDPVAQLKTTETDWRYARHMFKDGQGTSKAYAHASGNKPQTRSEVLPLPHRVAGNLLLGAVIQDPEKGPVQTTWRHGAYGFTKRGDQFVWGYFQKGPEGSPDGGNIPAIYAKVWLDSSGMIDIHFVNAFDHDVVVHSGYPAVRGFVHRDRCTVSDPYVRHKYHRKTGRWQLDLPPALSRDGLRVLTPGGETVVTEGSSIAPGHLSLQPSFYPAYHNDRLVALTFVTLPGANIRFTCRETAASVVLFKAGLTALPPSKIAVWKNLIMSMPAVSDLGNQLCTELQNHNALQNPSPALQQKIEKTVLSVGQHFLNPPQNKP